MKHISDLKLGFSFAHNYCESIESIVTNTGFVLIRFYSKKSPYKTKYSYLEYKEDIPVKDYPFDVDINLVHINIYMRFNHRYNKYNVYIKQR